MNADERILELEKQIEEIKSQFQMTKDAIWNTPSALVRLVYENGLIIEHANMLFYKLHRSSREEFWDKYENHYEKIMFEEDWLKLKECIEDAIVSPKQLNVEYRVNMGNQDYEWHFLQAHVIKEKGGSVKLQCTILNISDSKLIQQELDTERKKLETVIKMSGDMVFEYDIVTDYMTYTNTGDERLFSRENTENYSKSLSEIMKKEDEEVVCRLIEKLRSGWENFAMELQRMGTDKQYHWVSVTGKTFFSMDGKPEKVLGAIRNIDEQKKREREIIEKTQKDSLTGLYNYVTARKMVESRIEGMKPGEMSYLIICDVDDFKKLNDENGQVFGDAVICSFADEASLILPDAIKARLSGDEFLIYVENITREEVESQLKKLNTLMFDRYKDDKTGPRITCSIGAVVVDGTVKNYNTLFRMADNALYMVKSQKKGTCQIIDSVEEGIPYKSYLESEHNRDTNVRKDTLIRTDEELVLFCVELLENVVNTTSAIKMICERVCRFFDLDDMVCVEHAEKGMDVLYQWSKTEKYEYTQRMYNKGIYEWDLLVKKADDQGVTIYGEKDTEHIETENAKGIMLVFSTEFTDYRGSIVFADRRKYRDWNREKETLLRVSKHIFAHLRIIKQKEQERREVIHKLNYDELTGLPMYNYCISIAKQYMADNAGKNVYCVNSDFSNFQYLNDVYGYEAGNKVLVSFAQALEEYNSGIVFSRVTSDRFFGFIKGESAEEACKSYLQFTCDFARNINNCYNQCNVVIATGFYEVKEGDSDIAVIVDNANEARKKCKVQKMSTSIFVYTDEMKKEVESARALEANIVSAYNNGEFSAYLQPKVSLKTGKIVGAEALVRWIKPDGVVIMPGQFIDVSERSGFITKIDFAVLDCVMKYLSEAIALGEEVVPISVNFSRVNNEYADFVPNVRKRLTDYSVPSSLLEVEVTESLFYADMDKLKSNTEMLRNSGIEVSVDDFGSGYSSLNLLSRVAADTIKLDREFLRDTLNTAKEQNATIIIKYLVRMLKKLGFKVLAEGVETQEQMELLKSTDCDMVQGYYYAKPMPIAEFRKFLKEFNREEV